MVKPHLLNSYKLVVHVLIHVSLSLFGLPEHPPFMCFFSDWIPAQAGFRTSAVQAMACALTVCAHVMHIIWVMHVIFLCVQTTAATAMEPATMKCTAATVKKGIKVCSLFNFCFLCQHQNCV